MASKRHVRWKQCERKKKYMTINEARIVAVKLRLGKSIFVSAYGCRYCGGFHVGHKKKRWGGGE
jgi:hypothetical protein